MSEHSTHTNSHGSGELLLGITRDPILRPAGILMVVVGAIWSLFAGMAAEAGTYGQPLAAVALLVLGLLVAGAGKPGEQI
jgi:hypothetical protein